MSEATHLMIDGIKAILDGTKVFVHVNAKRLVMMKAGDCDENGEVLREIMLSEVRSLHVKGEEEYLLRLSLQSESVVLRFENHHLRDVVKSLLLSFMRTEGEVQKKILESDNEMRILFNNLKQCVSTGKLWALNKERTRRMSSLVRQQPAREMDMDEKEFVSTLTPTLLGIFGQMNCSLTQFYNLLSQSYFWDIKNQKGSLDRMISAAVRGCEAKQDFATRINSYSVLALRSVEKVEMPVEKKTTRKMEFLPIYLPERAKVERERRSVVLGKMELVCELGLTVEPMVERIVFDGKELAWVRDLSRMVYKATREGDTGFLEEAKKATDALITDVKRKYGNDGIVYLGRILPIRFMKMCENGPGVHGG